jgi:hypothetical protein
MISGSLQDITCEYQGGFEALLATKGLIDELNADHSRGAVPATAFTRSPLSMHFYDSIIVFEKGRRTKDGPANWQLLTATNHSIAQSGAAFGAVSARQRRLGTKLPGGAGAWQSVFLW